MRLKRALEFLFDVPIKISQKYAENKKIFLDWVGPREPIRIVRTDGGFGDPIEVFYDSDNSESSDDEIISTKRRKLSLNNN